MQLLVHSFRIHLPAYSVFLILLAMFPMIVTLSTKLATVDELLMVFIAYEISDDDVPLPNFLRNFRSV